MKARLTSDGKYWLVYAYLPKGKGKRISKRFRKDERGSKTRAEGYRRWLQEWIDRNNRTILDPGEAADLAAAKWELRRSGKPCTLFEAARFFRERQAHVVVSEIPNTRTAVGAFLEDEKRRGTAKVTFDGYRKRIARVAERFGSVPVDALAGEKLVDWAMSRRNSPVETRNMVYAIKRFHGFCVSKGWTPAGELFSPQDLARLPRRKNTRVPTILSAGEAHAVVGNVPRPSLAGALFRHYTGMRVATLSKMTGSNFDAGARLVSVPREIDKLGDRGVNRYLDMLPDRFWTLWSRLEEQGAAPGPGEKLITSESRFHADTGEAFRAAGITGQTPNTLRRTTASHGLLYYGIETMLLLMGHKGNSNVFWNNYYVPTLKRDAGPFFDELELS